jgi:hypothetical protein
VTIALSTAPLYEFAKGLKYREPKFINWKHNFKFLWILSRGAVDNAMVTSYNVASQIIYKNVVNWDVLDNVHDDVVRSL